MRIAGVGILLVYVLFLLIGCDSTAGSRDMIHLPPGDATRGKEHFVALGCISCHTVLNETLPAPEIAGPVRIRLGNTTSTALTYAQLVTSIVNPSHRVSRFHLKKYASADGLPTMPVYNDVMTIAQLSDLVAFLAPHYAKASRPGYQYPVYKDLPGDQKRNESSPD